MDTDTDTWELHRGDALELLDDAEAIPDESAHAIVCDPPYGIAFMGESWDDFDPHEYQEWCRKWAERALRVVKPGGHLLAFSGERTFHRLMCGVEDAGWTVRTSIMWLHGQGFPKGSDISKHIDRYYDAEDEREAVGKYHNPDGTTRDYSNAEDGEIYGDIGQTNDGRTRTAPATSEAERWSGWRSQLKPAFEPIIVARKPLSESAIYRNVLEHGTGAYNVDACRVPIETVNGGNLADNPHLREDGDGYDDTGNVFKGDLNTQRSSNDGSGRHPANVVLDSEAADLLDAQSGECPTGELTSKNWSVSDGNNVYGDYGPDGSGYSPPEQGGGASRFYYTSKASRSDRSHDGEIENDHPTVKPTDLMAWLVRLVTREGQTILDPFAGSGTTGVACMEEGRRFVGIERDDEYADLAEERISHTAAEQPQQDLAAYAAANSDD